MGASNFGNSGSGYDSTGSSGSAGSTGGTGSSTSAGSGAYGSSGSSGSSGSTGSMGSSGGSFDTGTSNVSNTDRGSMGGTSGSMGSSSTGGSTSQSDTEVPMERAKETMRSGMNAAEDAFGQLQSKASELTSRLIDNIDVDDLTRRLEEQVRDHPTRTLLVAVGAGFLLGRAAKR